MVQTPPPSPKKHFRRSICAVTVALLLHSASVSAAQEPSPVKYAIEAMPADAALLEFARQANLTVVFPYSVVKGMQASPVQGYFYAKQAIETLLTGTKLQATLTDDNQLIIKKIPEIPPPPKSLFNQIIDFFRAGNEELVTIDPKLEDDGFEQIIVRGYKASLRQSLDVKRDSDMVMDNIQAIEIGKFPDQNLAESLQRIAGVSIDRAEGEGQFVTVRGFGPEFNTVLYNGRRLATDNLGREFSFDTLASELVSGVNVYKTQQTAIQAGGIGSTIDIETARPLAIPHLQMSASIKSQYDRNSQSFSPQYTALFSNAYLDNTLGVQVSFNQQRREARIDEAQIDGWLLNTDIPVEQFIERPANIFVPRNYDQRVRFDQRQRTGATLVLQYRPNPEIEITADALHTELDIQTNATSMGHWFTSSNLENVATDHNGTVVEFQQQVGHATDFHARSFDRPSQLDAIGLNFKSHSGGHLTWQADWSDSRARVKDPSGAGNALSLIGYLNRSAFNHSYGERLPRISNFASANANVLDAFGQPTGVGHYLDPANGKSHVMLRRGWNIDDRVQQLRLDASWDGELDGLTQINFGLLVSKQSKDNQRFDNEADAAHCSFCGYFPSPDIPDGFQTVFDAGEDFLSGISGSQFLPKSWLRHDAGQLFQYLEQVGNVDLSARKRGNSFSVNETTSAAYIETLMTGNAWEMEYSAHLGFRYEYTDVTIDAFSEQLLGLVVLDQTELGQVTGDTVPVSFSHHYDNWLPNANIRLDINPRWVARAAFSRSITRPTISQLAPSVSLNTTRQGGDLRASAGTPELMPFESTNFDLALDYYYADASYLSLSYFHKDVKNFIVTQTYKRIFDGVTDPSTGTDPMAPDDQDQLAEFDLVQPKNGERANVNGLELSINHSFANTGLGISANMTKVDSNAQLDVNDLASKFALTGLSDSKNLVLYYEKNAWQWRLAWNHRDGFLQSLVQIQGGEPTFVASYEQLDFSASYDINQHLSLFFEAINLGNEEVWKHGRYSNQLLLVQDTGSRYAFGIRAKI